MAEDPVPEVSKCRCGCGGSPDHIHAPWDVRHGRWCQYLQSRAIGPRGKTLLSESHRDCANAKIHVELMDRAS